MNWIMENLLYIAHNLQNHLETLRQFTATPGFGVTRLPFSKEARQAIDYIKDQMEQIGLCTWIDASGAVHGRLDGTDPDAPTILIGSHYDTVKSGGAYDGIAGIVSAIEVARILKENNVQMKYPLEIIATNDEEGITYGVCFLTSKALLGRWTITDLKQLHDTAGESIYDAILRFGLDPNKIEDCKIDPLNVKCFIEIHIEQGPVLDSKGIQLGLVDCIAGLQRYHIQMIGKSNHAGSTPMDMRSDAVDASTKVISCISEWAKTEGGGTVATVGFMQVFPNALNTISGKTEWVLDCRSSDEEKIQHIVEKLTQKLEEVKSKTGVDYKIEPLVHVKPGYMNKELLEQLEKSCCTFGYSYQKIMSGATHDAHLMSEEVDTIMLFVPSKDGISHSPEESSKYEDLARAVYVVSDMISNLN